MINPKKLRTLDLENLDLNLPKSQNMPTLLPTPSTPHTTIYFLNVIYIC
jgi:hypothetical protein